MFRLKFCSSILNQLTVVKPQVFGLSLVKRSAGHSKWANIKHDKAIIDTKRATTFSRMARMVRVAIQEGGSTNPAVNSHLKTVIDQATKLNMPLATINNQIKKFNANDAQLKRYFLEIKSINKVFVICVVYTDNIAGLKMNVHTAMRKATNTTFGEVKHFFDEIGMIQVTRADGVYTDASDFENKLTDDAIECNAQEVEDIDFETKSATFTCRPIEIEQVKRVLLNMGYTVDLAEHVFIPNCTYKLSEVELKTVETLKSRLLKIDGVENVFDNIEEPST